MAFVRDTVAHKLFGKKQKNKRDIRKGLTVSDRRTLLCIVWPGHALISSNSSCVSPIGKEIPQRRNQQQFLELLYSLFVDDTTTIEYPQRPYQKKGGPKSVTTSIEKN